MEITWNKNTGTSTFSELPAQVLELTGPDGKVHPFRCVGNNSGLVYVAEVGRGKSKRTYWVTLKPTQAGW